MAVAEAHLSQPKVMNGSDEDQQRGLFCEALDQELLTAQVIPLTPRPTGQTEVFRTFKQELLRGIIHRFGPRTTNLRRRKKNFLVVANLCSALCKLFPASEKSVADASEYYIAMIRSGLCSGGVGRGNGPIAAP